ncbi:hypothetical protein [Shimia sp.]|uniref:hypothetical protein n=1 Tax=Shimia sp. TaxID=1954381 RepID=UPI003B8CAD02
MAEDDGKMPSAQARWIEAARAGVDDEESLLQQEGVSLSQYRRIHDLSEEDRAAVSRCLDHGRSDIEAGKGVVLDDAYLSRLRDRALSRR